MYVLFIKDSLDEMLDKNARIHQKREEVRSWVVSASRREELARFESFLNAWIVLINGRE